MPYLQQNNSKDNDKRNDVNTRGLTFYNKDGFDPSSLSLGYWNDSMMTIRINPALEPAKQTQTRIFDYDKTVSTAIGVPGIKMLAHTIKTYILPAIVAGEDKSVGIQIGGDGLVVVGTGKRQTGDIRPFIAIHKELNPSTKRPNMSIYYEFNRAQAIENYNEETGDYALYDTVHSELLLFLDVLDASIKALSKADAHAQRTVMRFFNDKLMAAVGGDTSNGYSGGNRSAKNIDWSTGASSSQQSSSMDELNATLSSIGDINDLMN